MGGDAMQLELYRRGRFWYVRGTVRAGSASKPINESTRVASRATAEIIAAKREAAILDELIFGTKAVITFSQAAGSYDAAGGSQRFMQKLVDRFGPLPLKSITQADLDQAAAELYPAATPETRNRQCYTPFVAVWRHAAARGWAEQREWSRPRKRKGTGVVVLRTRAGTRPTDYETAARFCLAMSPAPSMLMTFLFFTGMRPIEAFALGADQVDVAARWMVLPSSKTGEPRGVPLHWWLAEWIGPLVERARVDGGRVWRAPQGTPYPLTDETGGGQMSTAIRGARKRTGIAGVSAYTARHTVSTQLVVAGVHPHVKDQILGHAADDMSRHYTHVPQAPLIEAIDKLPVPALWRTARWLADPVGMSRKKIEGAGRRTDLERRTG